MTDTYRALCEELVEELEVWIGYGDEADCADAHAVVDRARAALAEQPVGPSDEELNALWNEQYGYTGSARMMNLFEFRDGARAVLARWGQS